MNEHPVSAGRSSLNSRVGSVGLVILWAVLCGCGRSSPPSTAGAPGAGETSENSPRHRSVTNYPLKGVVKAVEMEFEHVRIAHEAIPGFMDAMQMRFSYPDKKTLESLRPGDQVLGTLRVEKENDVVTSYALLDLKVTEPVRAKRLVLDTSTGKVELRPEPKRLAPGDLVPDFTMTLQDGKAAKLSNFRGKVVVLTFIYTRCPLPDFCPLMDKKFRELAERVSASPTLEHSVRLVSLSFDPDHDTPEVLARHAQIHGAIPPLWVYAVASYEELAKIGPPLGLLYGPGKNEIVHNLCTAVIDPEGKLARVAVGKSLNRWTTADILKTISAQIPAVQN